jgi:prophage regulatory protein
MIRGDFVIIGFDMPTKPKRFCMSKDRIIRLPEALHRTGFSLSSWYRKLETDANFPKPIKLGARSVGYLEAEIDAFIERLSAQAN